MDPYSVLEVSRDADPATIKRSYRRLVRTIHPDHNPGVDPRRFLLVQNAYEHLVEGKPFRYAGEQTAPTPSAPRHSRGYQPWDEPADPNLDKRIEADRLREKRLARIERERQRYLANLGKRQQAVRTDHFAAVQAICDEFAQRNAEIDRLVAELEREYDTSQPYTKTVFDSHVHMASDARRTLTGKRDAALLAEETSHADALAEIDAKRQTINATFDRDAQRAFDEYEETIKRYS